MKMLRYKPKRKRAAVSVLSPEKIAIRQRALEALSLREAGVSLQDIATNLGYGSTASVYNAIKLILDLGTRERVDEMRALENNRLDRMFMALWPRCLRGDVWAIDRALAIMQRRAALYGLDAPTRINLQAMILQVAQQEGISPIELQAVSEQLLKDFAG